MTVRVIPLFEDVNRLATDMPKFIIHLEGKSMSIVTWVEAGKKYHAVFDQKYFKSRAENFPIFESHRRTLQEIISFSEDDVLLISGDRKKFRIIQPIGANQTGEQSGRRIA